MRYIPFEWQNHDGFCHSNSLLQMDLIQDAGGVFTFSFLTSGQQIDPKVYPDLC